MPFCFVQDADRRISIQQRRHQGSDRHDMSRPTPLNLSIRAGCNQGADRIARAAHSDRVLMPRSDIDAILFRLLLSVDVGCLSIFDTCGAVDLETD